MPPTVDDPDHVQLEGDVTAYLAGKGFMLPAEMTYHFVMDKEHKAILQKRYSWTGLYVRSRADRLAIHSTAEIEFEWECKTIKPPHQNLAMEALPIFHHIAKRLLGVRCLYVVRRLGENPKDYGFWIAPDENLPEFSKLMIPGAARIPDVEVFRSYCQWCCPATKIVEFDSCRGSGDPFLLIDAATLDDLEDWRSLGTDLLPYSKERR